MKTEELKSILENGEFDTDKKISEIHRLNGLDIAREQSKYSDYDTLKATATKYSDYDVILNERDTLKANQDKYKDYDTVLAERDALKTEKEDREFSDRFVAAMGKNKPKNDLTQKGLMDLFKSEVAKPENKEKQDADIFNAMVKGKESDYFESSFRLTMTPANPSIKTSTDAESYLDELYKNNPYYKKIN